MDDTVRSTQTAALVDEVLRVPVKMTVLNRTAGCADDAPIILYVVGACIPRVGTESDDRILAHMQARGYDVVVIDYLGSAAAHPPMLDWAVQQLRTRLMGGAFFDQSVLPRNRHRDTFVVPSGYDVSLNHVFWSIDRHASDGTLEKIVEIWNNDFRGFHGARIIRWTDADGRRKPTQNGFDGSAPVWLDADGAENPDGAYLRIRHTKAEQIADCVKPDSTPIDLNLYMHLIYPVRPVQAVPVLCLANSAANMADCAANPERPQLNGAVFRGYAGVIYDYGYTPMARGDHYGYFDGNHPESGSVTGDNVTYAIQFYNDKKINTAAMRYLRYLARADERFCFRPDAIGVFGNSKGGWMTFLGEPHPERFPEARFLPGHHGESRFDNGKTQPYGSIRGGAPQPWREYRGQTLDSGAQLIYAGCGGAEDFISPAHCPMYIAGNLKDRSYFGRANSFVNLCRIYDVPAVYLVLDIGHTLAFGTDVRYEVDAYDAFFRFADYYLNDGNLEVLYTDPADERDAVSPASEITIKFIGTVDAREIRKIAVTDADGRFIRGTWRAQYGNTEWTFTPAALLRCGMTYHIAIPDGICGSNGTHLNASVCRSFRTTPGIGDPVPMDAWISAEKGVSIPLPKLPDRGNCAAFLRIRAANDAANVLRVCAADRAGHPVATVGRLYFGGAGVYTLDLTATLPALRRAEAAALLLTAEKAAGETPLLSAPLDCDLGGGRVGDWMTSEFAAAPDGTPALKISVGLNRRFRNDWFYTNTELYCPDSDAYESAPLLRGLRQDDVGRKLHIRLRIFDTVSRKMKVELNSCINEEGRCADYNRNMYQFRTVACEWMPFAFDYTVYEPPMIAEGVHDKRLIVKAESTGETHAPFYLSDISVTEETTDVWVTEAAIELRDGSCE